MLVNHETHHYLTEYQQCQDYETPHLSTHPVLSAQQGATLGFIRDFVRFKAFKPIESLQVWG